MELSRLKSIEIQVGFLRLEDLTGAARMQINPNAKKRVQWRVLVPS